MGSMKSGPKSDSREVTLLLNALYALAAAVGVALLVFGLYPFNFRQPNMAELDAHRHLLHFEKPSYAILAPVPDALRTTANRPFTIAIAASTSRYDSRFVPQIVSVYAASPGQGGRSTQGCLQKILVMGQWKAGIVFRFYNPATGRKEEFGYSDAFRSDRPSLIVLRSTPAETVIYVHGRPVDSWPFSAHLDLTRAEEIVLGNSANGRESWTGDLYGLQLYDRALTPKEIAHLASETDIGRQPLPSVKGLVLSLSLEAEPSLPGAGRTVPRLSIPQPFHAPDPGILTPPWVDFKLNRGFAVDTLINLLGFLPPGIVAGLIFLLRGVSRRRNLILSGAICGLVSLTIELLQAILPTRTSSLSDLILNTLGGILGACIAVGLAPRLITSLTRILGDLGRKWARRGAAAP